MKITPLEIRQKDFEKKLRGYDKDEVNAFLLSLSNEWERVLDENKELHIKLQQSEKEVDKLREVEGSLFKTLKTAEQTGANVIDQANKAADLHMKETKMNAEALLVESKSKAQAIVEQAEVEARHVVEELQDAVKQIEQDYHALDNHKQNALEELKNLSVSLIDRVEMSSKEKRTFDFEDYIKRVKALAKDTEQRIKTERTSIDEKVKTLETPPLDVDDIIQEVKEDKELSVDRGVASKKVMDSPTVQAINNESMEDEPKKPTTKRVMHKKVKKSEVFNMPAQEKKTTQSTPPAKEKVEKPTKEKGSTISFFDELDLE